MRHPLAIKKILVLLSGFYVLISYQNCGEQLKYNAALQDTPANLGPQSFLEKILQDIDLILADQPQQQGSATCSYEPPVCLQQGDTDRDCVYASVKAYYESLRCAGFTVESNDQCFMAVSKNRPLIMEPVLLDATCFNADATTPMAVNLGMCYGEEIGFNKEAPSTGMRISAWADLGTEFPYSRQVRQLQFYPQQQSSLLQLYALGGDEKLTDACGKNRNAKAMDLRIEVVPQSHP